MAKPVLSALINADRRRAGFPGEHMLTAGAGMALLRASRRRSGLTGLLALAAGVALLARAASGRDGIRRVIGR